MAVFFIQWWALSVFAVWQLISIQVPVIMFQLATFFSNIGGILNGIVYIVISRRRNPKQKKGKTSSSEETGTVNVTTIEINKLDKIAD